MRGQEKELRERDQRIDDLLETVRRQAEEIRQLKTRIAELEAALGQRKEANASKPPKFSGNYSLGQQEKQRSGRRKKKSPGRRPNSLKLSQVQRTQDVYPDGVSSERCRFSRDRFVWRLEDGRAVFVRYRLHRENGTYNIACTHAMEGNTDQALNWLDRAVETGHVSVRQILGDEDLETLQDEPRFESILERADELDDDDDRHFRMRKIKSGKERKNARVNLH